MESNHQTTRSRKDFRPRYGLVIATSKNCPKGPSNETSQSVNSFITDSDWEKIRKKIAKYNWSYTWNLTLPPSWTLISQMGAIPKPQVYEESSVQIVDLIHNLLDTLPEYGSLGYLLDILWVTDNVPDDIACPMTSVNNENTQGLSTALYGALKRSYDWHGAHIQVINTEANSFQTTAETRPLNDVADDNFLQLEIGAKIVPLQDFITKNDCFSSCKSKCSSDRLIWRGSLGFYEELDNTFTLRRMEGFQMFAKDDNSMEVLTFLHGSSTEDVKPKILISRTLKVISRCNVNSVPVYLLGNQHFYLTVNETDEVYDDFLCPDSEFFGGYSGVIVKLDCVSLPTDVSCKSKSSKFTLENWKQYITKSQSYIESLDQRDRFESEHETSVFSSISDQAGTENSVQSVHSFYFLLMNDYSGGLKAGEPYDNGTNTKLCILLDPSAAEGGGQLKTFNKVQDILFMKFNGEDDIIEEKQKVEKRLQELSIATECNAPKLYTFIRQVQSAVLEMILQNEGYESEYLSTDRLQSTLDAIQTRILRKINAFREEKVIPYELCNADSATEKHLEPIYYEEDDTLWEEKRFIAFIERLRKQSKEKNLPTSDDSTMKPNEGEFVILEAKEMLKLFTKDGLAKYPERSEELKVPQKLTRRGFDWDKEKENWPELLLSDYPDLAFNRNEQSEELDRERTKLQLMYVGSKETASTCHAQNSSKGPPPVVVTKRKDLSKNAGNVEVTEKSVRMNAEPSLKTQEAKNKRKSYGPNTTQLRRSPRKKVSTASIVNYNTYRSGIKKPLINIASGDGASLYSGDTNSIISNRRSLPGSTYQCAKKDKEACDKLAVDERGDSRATRNNRTLGNSSNNSKDDKVIHNSTVLSNGISEDNFKQKLRNAVYDALKGKDICEEHKLFKPCFKKLFEICMMYGKDLAKKNTRGGNSGTRQLLTKIAQQNVDSVINIEKTLFGE